jgi:hypothetical protein
MSALARFADSSRTSRDVREVPRPDIAIAKGDVPAHQCRRAGQALLQWRAFISRRNPTRSQRLPNPVRRRLTCLQRPRSLGGRARRYKTSDGADDFGVCIIRRVNEFHYAHQLSKSLL